MDYTKIPDNLAQACPARMEDGRGFTDYSSARCMQILGNPKSSFEYRMFLQHNAKHIMHDLRTRVESKMTCPPCKGVDTMLPEQYVYSCTSQVCKVTPGVHCGLGMHRNYATNFADVRKGDFKPQGDLVDDFHAYAAAS